MIPPSWNVWPQRVRNSQTFSPLKAQRRPLGVVFERVSETFCLDVLVAVEVNAPSTEELLSGSRPAVAVEASDRYGVHDRAFSATLAVCNPEQAAKGLRWSQQLARASSLRRRMSDQCAVSTGISACVRMWRVVPPKINCRSRLCV